MYTLEIVILSVAATLCACVALGVLLKPRATPGGMPNVVIDAMSGRESRYAAALSAIVPAEPFKRDFVAKVYDHVRASIDGGKMTDAVGSEIYRLCVDEGAGAYLERLERAYMRVFKLSELEDLAKLKRRIDKFDAKMARVLRKHVAEIGHLNDALIRKAVANVRSGRAGAQQAAPAQPRQRTQTTVAAP